MKENWERTKPLYTLSKKEIEELLQSFMSNKKLESAELLGGGLVNSNYKLQIESLENPLVLRISNEKNCKLENSLHRKLHKHLPVPEIYYSEIQGNQSFSIMEWREGIQLKKIMYSNDINAIKQSAFSVGSWLSEIRKNTFKESGFFNEDLEVNDPLKITPNSFLSFMEGFLFDGHTSHWLGKELTSELWEFALKNNHYLYNIDESPALVHSDYNGLNILISENKEQCKVTGIIDWEFAFAGPVHVDIGNMLRYENFPHIDVFEHAFIEGLQSGGVILQQEWKRISKLVDLVSLCDLLNNSYIGANRVKDIKQLISQTISNWKDY
ncbi:phosphotransferase family protein [Ornithinibacillus salinisoli]|uniref:Phosphotransferase family protein n=1 Tax=Ornithinibacillus salinisoli TaxID=1848459 RepID=A0ABW4W1I7_9BACI